MTKMTLQVMVLADRRTSPMIRVNLLDAAVPVSLAAFAFVLVRQ